MFKQLTYFDYLEDDLKTVQIKSRDLNALLTEAYSPPQKVFCSLKEQIDNILQEQQQLQEIASVILQQVTSNTYIPRTIDQYQLSQMLLNSLVLPEWFPHVFEKQYAKFKPELDLYSKNLAAMHDLQQKRKMMKEERENLELLYRRSLTISAFQKKESFTDIDIMEDVNNLRNRVKHVRKSFQHFGNQVSTKIKQFVQDIIDKTLNFNRAQSPSNVLGKSSKQASDIFRNASQMNSFNQYYMPLDIANDSIKTQARFKSSSPSAKYNNFTSNQKNAHSPRNDYYAQTQRFQSNKISKRIEPNYNSTNYYQIVQSNYGPGCKNHDQSRHHHRHTCSKKASQLLRCVKSEDRLINKSRQKDKFDYHQYLRSNF